MTGVLTSSGSIKTNTTPSTPNPLVLFDGLDSVDFVNNWTAYTNGASRGVQLSIIPSVMQTFTLLGFSVQIRLGLLKNFLGIPSQYFARLGQLWAGLYVNAPLPNIDSQDGGNAGAAFPPDLSTFAKVWDGKTDDVRIVRNVLATNGIGDLNNFTLIAATTMLPAPVEIGPSSQLGFGIVLTPSLLSFGGSTIPGLAVGSCQFTVLYQAATIDYNHAP